MREVNGVTFAGDQFNPAAINPQTEQTQLDSLIDALRAEYGHGVVIQDTGLPTEVERTFPFLITLALPLLGVDFKSQHGGSEYIPRFAFRAPNGGVVWLEVALPEQLRAQLSTAEGVGAEIVTDIYAANVATVLEKVREVWGVAGEIKALTPAPPAAAFSVTPTDLSVAFADETPDPETTIASWAWDFGDQATSTEKNPTHEYSAAGAYEVTLTVTNIAGGRGSVSHDVTVAAP
jgi:hypothetical protein